MARCSSPLARVTCLGIQMASCPELIYHLGKFLPPVETPAHLYFECQRTAASTICYGTSTMPSLHAWFPQTSTLPATTSRWPPGSTSWRTLMTSGKVREPLHGVSFCMRFSRTNRPRSSPSVRQTPYLSRSRPSGLESPRPCVPSSICPYLNGRKTHATSSPSPRTLSSTNLSSTARYMRGWRSQTLHLRSVMLWQEREISLLRELGVHMAGVVTFPVMIHSIVSPYFRAICRKIVVRGSF
jgi:hypothetical protein